MFYLLKSVFRGSIQLGRVLLVVVHFLSVQAFLPLPPFLGHSLHEADHMKVFVDDPLQVRVVEVEVLRDLEQGGAAMHFSVEVIGQGELLAGLVGGGGVLVGLPAALEDRLVELEQVLEPDQVPLDVLGLLDLLLDEAHERE